MFGVKAVKQNISPSPDLLALLETFRQMVNDCIRIGLKENATSLKSLSLKAYRELSRYKIPSYYKLCAISATVGILRNYRKTKRKNPNPKTPYARRLMLTTCYGFKIKDGKLRLPIQPRKYEQLELNQHTIEVLSNSSLNIRSITLTPSTISISVLKETAEIAPNGYIGIDRNLNNVTTASNNGEVTVYDLSRTTKIKATYREVKSHFKRNDIRTRRSGKAYLSFTLIPEAPPRNARYVGLIPE